jgi:carboxyl-terminal processing protease
MKITRGAAKAPAPESRVESGKIGVIKVHSLETGDADKVRDQVQSLSKQGVQKLVLDLRGVAGGKIEEGVAVANLFIKSGEIAKILGKDNAVLKSFAADASKAVFDGKANVLIDFGTAGAAEVVASAFAETKRVDVVGERSFGAGTEQQLSTLRSGDGLLLTTAKWASGSGVTFLGEERTNTGIKPTVEVKRPDTPEVGEVEELIDQQEEENENPAPTGTPVPVATPEKAKPAAEDVQLKKALELLSEKAAAKTAGAK